MSIAILVGVYLIAASSIFTALTLMALCWFLWKVRAELKAIRDSSLGLDKPVTLLQEMSEAVNSFAAFLPGMLKISQEQVKSALGLESAVTAFTRLNFGVDTPPRNDHFTALADNDEITRIMGEQGLSHEEAKQELNRQRQYANLSMES